MPVSGSPFVTSASPIAAQRAVGDLAERRSRRGADERAMRLLDVVDLPEHERVVDPRQRGEAEADVVAAERGEVVAGEDRAVAEQLRPGGHGGLEIAGGEDDVREAVEHHWHSSRRFLTECCQGGTIARRQDTVKAESHTPEGEALTRLLVEVIRLGELFTQTGESLAKAEGQTLARWLVARHARRRPGAGRGDRPAPPPRAPERAAGRRPARAATGSSRTRTIRATAGPSSRA